MPQGCACGGICLDTCHAFQAGYDLAREEGLYEIVREIERDIGVQRVRLIHLNDSKRAFHSGLTGMSTSAQGRSERKAETDHPSSFTK